MHRSVQRCRDPAALLLTVDFGLRLDSQAGLGELVLGPEHFGLAANLGSFDRDRGVGIELGSFAFRARRRVTVMRRLAAPPPQDQRQQVDQHEKCDRQQAQRQRPAAGERDVVHRDPTRTEARAGIRERAAPRVVDRLLLARDRGVQLGCLPVARRQGIGQLALGIGEKLVGRSCFGPGTRHAGDSRLRARRGRVVFAARDDQRLVLVRPGLLDRGIEAASGRPGLPQGCRCLLDRGRRVRNPQRPFFQAPVDCARKHDERGQLADDGTDRHRDGPAPGGVRPAPIGPAGDGADHGPNQQTQYQRQRDNGEHRPANRLAHRDGGDEPRERCTRQHNRAGNGVAGPLVPLTEFAPLPASEPSENSPDAGSGCARLCKTVGVHQTPNTSKSSSVPGHRPTHRTEAPTCGGVHNWDREADNTVPCRSVRVAYQGVSDAKFPRRDRINGLSRR